MTKFNLTSKQIAEHFNVDVSTVFRWVKSETLQYGKHYIDLSNSGARRPLYRFNLEACQNFFVSMPPEKR